MADLISIAEHEGKVQAIALGIMAATGRYPKITRQGGGKVLIELYPDQVETGREIVRDWLSAGPSDIQVDIKPVVVPVVMEKYWPWVIGVPVGIVALGYLLGRIGKK